MKPGRWWARLLTLLTRAESGAIVFAVVLLLAYTVLPLALYLWQGGNPYYLQLAGIAVVGAPCVVIGSRIKVIRSSRGHVAGRPSRAVLPFVVAVWTAFTSFVILACVTADRIPIVAALQGVDADTLVLLRERFLKAREGWEESFVYINAILAGALVPYSLMLAMLRRFRYRWVLFVVFLVYCVSFVEKAFFLKAILPLMYLVAQRRISTRVRPRVLIAATAGVLVFVTVASGTGSRSARPSGEEFFSTSFATEGPIAFLAWRTVAVPVVTAADTLLVFEQVFGSRPLMGATSSLLAGTFGQERVNVERQVFAAQWGQTETETGSSNSVYLTEAFLNFGYIGVVMFSIAIGMIFGAFAASRDEAFRSLWMLFALSVSVAPLTATLFSSGFLLIVALSLVFKLDERRPRPAPVARTSEE